MERCLHSHCEAIGNIFFLPSVLSSAKIHVKRRLLTWPVSIVKDFVSGHFSAKIFNEIFLWTGLLRCLWSCHHWHSHYWCRWVSQSTHMEGFESWAAPFLLPTFFFLPLQYRFIIILSVHRTDQARASFLSYWLHILKQMCKEAIWMQGYIRAWMTFR